LIASSADFWSSGIFLWSALGILIVLSQLPSGSQTVLAPITLAGVTICSSSLLMLEVFSIILTVILLSSLSCLLTFRRSGLFALDPPLTIMIIIFGSFTVLWMT